jgi:hypothetical protein
MIRQSWTFALLFSSAVFTFVISVCVAFLVQKYATER